MPSSTIRLSPGARVLFLTKDPTLIERQLRGELTLRMDDIAIDDLLDDVNTDVMTPAWTCFDYLPDEIARNAYAGLIIDGRQLIPRDALFAGGFEVIVSGYRKGTGSSRETAVQAEKWSGIRIAIAASFAPIHKRNNLNQGVLMAHHDVLRRLQSGEAVPIADFQQDCDPIERLIVESGGLLPLSERVASGAVKLPALSQRPARPQTMVEKILSRHLVDANASAALVPGDAVMVRVDAGYSHDYTTAQVHHFLQQVHGASYRIKDPAKFAVFEDHLIYADSVPRIAPYRDKIERLRELQREFQRHTGVRNHAATDGRSPGICHQIARETFIDPGDFVQATDSHTCMGGAGNALAWGVGATEYAALIHSGMTAVTVPESIRFELHGTLAPGVTAKDLMLHILAGPARRQETLDRVIEFGGPGLRGLSMDERATLANMATECAAKTGICEADDSLFDWLRAIRPDVDIDALRTRTVAPDAGATYTGGVHRIDLDKLEPMVATPGDPARGIPADPTNGALVREIGRVRIDIAYGGSCTAGKHEDLDMYARVIAEARACGRSVAPGVEFFIQCGSLAVEAHARARGYIELFREAGVRLVAPGCGACIGCGPGASSHESQVTVSAINRNFKGRSGPGELWLASPLTVAASAIEGHITAYRPGLWGDAATKEATH
ncbi:aconitase family protein [Variovorax sp. J22P271]|uniref:aconitase family protein n=1 Tax=Variovorax davisae TaxID=3053515 RepID=UPI0025768FC9|nr:aconitase family protein [Variovorax sp. J22P271]MDM0032386.1 aconitase family protein [Variovorax sp. J22P271]